LGGRGNPVAHGYFQSLAVPFAQEKWHEAHQSDVDHPQRGKDEIAERVLNHQKKGMKRVYDRFAYSPQKRDAIKKWAKYLRDLLAQAQGERAPAG
jgi:hypothetical protein